MRGIQFDLRPLVSLYQCFPTRIDGLTSADFCRLGILVQTAMDIFEIWIFAGKRASNDLILEQYFSNQ